MRIGTKGKVHPHMSMRREGKRREEAQRRMTECEPAVGAGGEQWCGWRAMHRMLGRIPHTTGGGGSRRASLAGISLAT